MKKFVSFIMALVVVFAMTSCHRTNGEKAAVVESTVDSIVDAVAEPMVVEHTIALDRQAMYLNHSNDYRWYETGVQLNDWLDEDCDGTFNLVVNVFQAVEDRGAGSFDTYVVKYQHLADGTVNEESVHGFWIEDYPLEEEAIVVTFEQAFAAIMQTNYPKPHTRQVVLREPIGPKACNPQWIFGNLHSQLYVDAVTGEVRPTSPAFNDEPALSKPLGEWP